MFPSQKRPYFRFDATLSVSHLQAPPDSCVLSRPKATSPSTSLELLGPSAFLSLETLLFTPYEASGGCCPTSPEVSLSGFGYPLSDLKSLNPWKPLSAPHAPGLRPSKLSSSTVIEKVFQLPLSALALSFKTFSALNRRFDGLLSPWKPYPSLQPDGLDPAGALALLGFLTSQALLPSVGSQRRLSPKISLSVLDPLVSRETGSPNSQGLANRRPGIFLYRTPACLAFLPRFTPTISSKT